MSMVMESLDNLTDLELVERATVGDRGAFETLAGRHYTLVYRVAYKWCGIRETAEDITQEVFCKLARTIHSYRGGSAFMTWLYRVTVNTAKDFHRRNARKLANEAAYTKELKAEAPKGVAALSGAEEHTEKRERSEELQRALAALSPKLRETVVLVLSEGLTHKEAAAVLGCAETTVSWRVFKARGKLKKLLSPEV
ncbi:MAG: RNA polymerase sigma factor [Thermodesulfobacteriota bacterium]